MSESPNLAAHPAAAIFPLLEGEAFEALVEDIRKRGLRNPITLDKERRVLDGRNRLRACKEAGVEPDFDLYEGGDVLGFVISQNVARRHLDESQRAMCAARALKTLSLDWSTNVKIFNISRQTLAYAKTVLEKGTREIIEAVEGGRVAVSRAAEIIELDAETQESLSKLPPRDVVANHERIKRDKRRAEIYQRHKPTPDMPREKWPVLYADPPWEDEFGVTDRATDNHYATMTIDEIKALPVADLAQPDAVLYLWALPHMLEQGLAVMASWGFRYRTHMVWSKDKIGMGQWTRNEHELLLIGRRGEFPPPPEKYRVGSVVDAPSEKRHSAKPAYFRELIECWYPDLPKIELFQRGQPLPGWTVWGAEAAQQVA